MSNSHSPRLPENWRIARIGDVARVNPKVDKLQFDSQLEVDFVPMAALGAGTGSINLKTQRKFVEVQKGFTPFIEGDVLFAKITPCMENGKMAIVPKLRNGLGFGSTEFHVLRPQNGISAAYLYYYVSSESFRRNAEHNMTGAVGQRRVPTTYFTQCELPLPPANEQRRIVAKIEELFSELDKGVESLTTARQQLKLYRQAVLKHAFEGKLTADWQRTGSSESDESAATIKTVQSVAKLTSKELDVVSMLTKRWGWVRLFELFDSTPQNGLYKPASFYGSGTPIIRIDSFYDGRLISSKELKRLNLETQEATRFALRENDLLINRVNSIEYLGKCTVVRNLSETTVFESNIMRCRIREDLVLPKFVARYLSSRMGRKLLIANAKHAVNQASINQTDVGNTLIPLPPLDEQEEIMKILDELLSSSDRMDDECGYRQKQSLALRQSILSAAFQGQLTSRDVMIEQA